ncbi:hypothetical protein ACO0RG_002619 [Hanseniaspora osmophila]
MFKRGGGHGKDSDSELPLTSGARRTLKPKPMRLGKYSRLGIGSRMRLPWKHLISLFLLWLFSVQYFERNYVKSTIKSCSWNKWESWDKNAQPYRAALFGDPQIMDAHSYPGRPVIINLLTRKILDNYHRKNWRYIQNILSPNANLFLGDLFDGGRYWDDETWMEEYKRFNSIFEKKEYKMNIMSLPGNHDIGFGDTVIESSYNRFNTYFGETCSRYDLGNHTFYIVDTISLSDTKLPHLSDKVHEFLDNVDRDHLKTHPRIMLTHVPLHRNPSIQTCGPKRESKKDFPLMKGDQYQTVIDQDLSREVLEKIEPDLIFSGDDHDYCEITHQYTVGNTVQEAKEITTKSCAMNMGIAKPGVHLLSLYNPTNSLTGEKTYETEVCYLPSPYVPIICYITLGVFSAVYLILVVTCPKFFNNKVIKKLQTICQKHSGNKHAIAAETKESLLPQFAHSSVVKDKATNGFIGKIFNFFKDVLDELVVQTEEASKASSLFVSALIMSVSISFLFYWYYSF